MIVTTMPRKKDINNDLGEASIAVCQSGKGYKAIYKQSEVHQSSVRSGLSILNVKVQDS